MRLGPFLFVCKGSAPHAKIKSIATIKTKYWSIDGHASDTQPLPGRMEDAVDAENRCCPSPGSMAPGVVDVMVVPVSVGDAAIDSARADDVRGMMSSGKHLMRLVKLFPVNHSILESRDVVAIQVVSHRSAVHQYLKCAIVDVCATGNDAM